MLGDPGADRQSVLPAGAGLGTAAYGVPGRRRDGDRLAGGDHGRVLGHAAGRPARLPAAAANRAHLGRADRADLRPVDQLGAARRGPHAGLHVQDSAALAYAFGMAVTGTITITTLLFFYVVRYHGENRSGSSCSAASASAVDLLFFAANLTKLAHGAGCRCLIARRGVHRAHHLAARPRARHPPARARRGAAPCVRRPAARPAPAAPPGAGHSRLPQPGQGHHAARAARQRRAQPDPPRARPDPLDRDRPGAARPARRPAGDRRPRLQGRRDHPRHRTLRLHGQARRPRRCCR